jgi:hypothetical protein
LLAIVLAVGLTTRLSWWRTCNGTSATVANVGKRP